MSIIKLGAGTLDVSTELSTTQIAITNAANAFTWAIANNIATVTTATPHGLTFAPSAGVMPNYFVTFASVTITGGTGTVNGPVFRILSIPSTTTFTIYAGNITSATSSGASIIPVFIAPFTAQPLSQWAGGPVQGVAGTAASAPALTAPSYVYVQNGANAAVLLNVSANGLIYDQTNTAVPTSSPTTRTLAAVSTNFTGWMDQAVVYLAANGTAGTTTLSVVA
jgi:hypothetical protein